ncbi:MAG: hypothetical protein QOF07_1806 [Bradyrhizobium sp.]|jgi:outer membrane murein-binding lipoprotein Lpp|nr:hypothetical protein [Bradyrhizobium sp.]
MTRWIVEAILAATLVFAGTANNAVATPLPAAVQQWTPDTTDLSASRRARHHHHYASRGYYRPSQPFYYDRPYYYAPAPFVPFNFGYTVPWW